MRGRHLGNAVPLPYMLGQLNEGLEDGEDCGMALPAGPAKRVVAGEYFSSDQSNILHGGFLTYCYHLVSIDSPKLELVYWTWGLGIFFCSTAPVIGRPLIG